MGIEGEEERSHRIITGVGLAVGATLVALSLVPVEAFGAWGRGLFPSGNVAGPVGRWLAGLLVGTVGVSASAVPILVYLWACAAFGLLERRETLRWSAFLSLVILIVPPLAASIGLPLGGVAPWLAGDYGASGARTLASALSWLGGALLLLAVFAAGTVGTLGLGPFRAIASSAARLREGAAAALRAGRTTALSLRSGWSRLAPRVLRRAGGPTPGLWDRPVAAAVPGGEPAVAVAEGATRAERRGGNGQRRSGHELPDPGDPTAAARPPLELLSPAPRRDYVVTDRELDELGDVLIDKLRTFRVESRIGGRTTGPVVTQFEVVPASGVKVGKIAALSDDLALALKAPSVRIVAPIPGKGAVGVEVPNPEPKIVYLREILASDAYRRSRAELPLALGEDVRGQPYLADLARMPHLLIAGVTGSGKSVCINSIIFSLIYRHAPDRLRLLLIDPKMVELAGYNDLPHLRHPVVTDNADAATLLKWLVYEMERRYDWLSANGCRNLREFNHRVSRGLPVYAPGGNGSDGAGEDDAVEEPEVLPYLVLIVDELADLMMTVQAEVERPLAFLAQKARATGIHLVVATQRPSVNVITGLIKANFPCRIAFRVSSKVDSRTIIDQNGAETLLGNGDMLFLPPGESEPVRIQGTYVSTEDGERVVDWYRARAEADAEVPVEEEDVIELTRERERQEAEVDVVRETLEDRDPLFRQAAEVVVQHQQGSTSLLQRRLKIGYGRAARVVDQLEHAGIVGPPEGSKPREVLVTLDELDRIVSGLEG